VTWQEYLSTVDDSHQATTAKEHLALVCRECEGATGIVVELGSHFGFSTAAMAMAAPAAVVISVDLCDEVPQATRERYWHILGIGNIRPLQGRAASWLKVAGSVDLIFHDAAHGEAVRDEYFAAAALCRTLVIHDFEQLTHATRDEIAGLFVEHETHVDRLGRMLFIGRKDAKCVTA
jgi:predicted O-methyltransferase YrrM